MGKRLRNWDKNDAPSLATLMVETGPLTHLPKFSILKTFSVGKAGPGELERNRSREWLFYPVLTAYTPPPLVKKQQAKEPHLRLLLGAAPL